MYKRHLISDLIGARHFIAFVSLLTLIASSQDVSAQSQLAQDTYAIFEGSCLICHGADGAYRETLLMEHDALIGGGTVVPGNPNASELYKRLLGPTESGVQMPFGQPPLPPQSIDSQATIFYIDLRHYEWDRIDGWTKIEEAYPYHISFDAPAQTALREQLGRLQTQMNCVIPSVHIDWFLATASTPPLYHELLSLPLTDGELEQQLDVDVVGNLTNAPGVRVWRAGFNNSGVSNNNRVVERHTSRYGAYWKSYDFAGSVGTQNIFTHPLNFTHDGGEVIFNLPNGLQGYYLVNASGFRLDEAPINIVSNPAASDPTVRNGLSCIGCHTEGMKTLEDQVRSVIESNTNPPYNKAQALRLYVEKSDMDARVGDDMERYREALEETGGVIGGVEPISRFHEAFQGPVDAAYAAAVVGLETETFRQNIRENRGLQNVGLLALEGENGSVQRDTWTSSFRDVMYALDYPQQVGEPPVVTQPDIIPGGQVHIPDSNLRAAVAEGIRRSPDVPITASGMKRLRRIDLAGKGVRDLTGLEFATNLSELFLIDNQISDLSPIASLIELSDLDFSDNPLSDLSPLKGLKNLISLGFSRTLVSDLSPLQGLKNLTELEFSWTQVSDLSPLAGLLNLRKLHFHDTDVSDLSPLAGLLNLEFIWFADDNTISDLSPLAGLTNLKTISSWGNQVSDLSPLAGLTQLNHVDICGARLSDLSPLAGLTNLKSLYLSGSDVSDISPLAGLTGLTRLNFHRNNITDISPLAGLTNLTWLDVSIGKISDFSPLDHMRENIKLVWYDNPGFPEGGAKIEGPWLWVVLPDTKRDSGTDRLSEASGGTVTELEVATHGATEGKPVGDDVWTSHKLPPTGWKNIEDMLKHTPPHGVLYGTVSLYSPREQETTMYIGSIHGVKVWLNGALISEHLDGWWNNNYSNFFPVTLRQGRNVLLVAVATRSDENSNSFFGFESGTDYTVGTGIGYAVSKTPIHIGDTFTLDIRAENVFDLAGWQFDIAFDPTVLEAVDVSEGDFLKTDGGSTFFQSGRIDNAAGKITGLIAGRISEGGVSGSGSVLQVRFKAKAEGETGLTLQNFLFGSVTEESIPAGPLEIHITVEERLLTGECES